MKIVGLSVGVLVALACASSTLGAGVNFPNFQRVAGLKLNGDAAKVGNKLQLTAAEGSQTGSVFTKRRLINPSKSFKSKFKAEITDVGGEGADGIAFVLQPGPKEALGAGGGGLGYSHIAPSLAVELDIHHNPEANDPDGNHVAVHLNGDPSTAEESATPSFDLVDVTIFWVEYTAKKKTLRVFANTKNRKPAKPLIKFEKSLAGLFDRKRLRVGFTAATGSDFARQRLLNWSLNQR